MLDGENRDGDGEGSSAGSERVAGLFTLDAVGGLLGPGGLDGVGGLDGPGGLDGAEAEAIAAPPPVRRESGAAGAPQQ